MKKVIVLLSMGLFFTNSLFAANITSIGQLDGEALFHYSLLSDLQDSTTGTKTARSLSWVKNSEWVLGGGDDVNNRGSAFQNYVGSDSYFKTKFYPNIGDKECNAYGGSQGAWGKGSEFFRFIPGFWNRSTVSKCPNEPRDAWGGTPSYYCTFSNVRGSGISVHVLQLHWSDSARFDSSTRQFMVDKLNDFATLKDNEPGKHIIHVHAHNGPFIKNLGVQASSGKENCTFEDIELLIATADLVTDSSQHNARRFWYGEAFFQSTIEWWGGRLADDFDPDVSPNACLWYNTGIVSDRGHMEFHVFDNPTRIVAQYVRNELSSRQLVTPATWAHREGKDLLPIMKEVDGPTTYVDWSDFPLEPPPNDAAFISQSIPTNLDPGEMATVSVTLKNVGAESWSTATGHTLGSQNPQDNIIWNLSRVPVSGTVAPEAEVTFTFDIIAPATNAVLNFQWQMVDDAGDHQGWFGDLSVNQQIVVGVPPLDFEAEDADELIDAVVATNNDGYSGAGFVDTGLAGASIKWTQVNLTAGTASLDFRYSSADTRSMDLFVNGSWVESITFPATGVWTTWATYESAATLIEGNNTIELVQTSGGGPNMDVMTVTMTDVNTPPQFITTPDTAVDATEAYLYTAVAEDGEDDPVTLSCESVLPTWLSFDALTGELSGTPSTHDLGSIDIVLRASDGSRTTDQEFTLKISNPGNDAPEITSTPVTGVIENQAYSYTITATDDDADSLTYSAGSIPSWLTVSGNVLSGTPAPEHTGMHAVTVSVSDGMVSVDQTFNVMVFETPVAANLIVNGSFETGSTLGWDVASPDESFVSNSVVDDGDYALKFTTTDGYIPKTKQVVDIEPGTDYIFTYSINWPEDNGGAFSVNLNPIEHPVYYEGTSGWVSETIAFNSGTNSSVSLELYANGTFSGTVYVDDFSLASTAAENMAPVITSVPETDVVAGDDYGYTLLAADAEGDSLTFSEVAIPSGFSFDAAVGILSGTPVEAGTLSVELSVSDGQGGSDSQTFEITVEPGAGYDRWAGDYPVGGPLEDDDEDGLNNLYEYALGGNPTAGGDDVDPVFVKSGDGFDYTFKQRNDDTTLIYVVQVCSDLTSESWVTAVTDVVTNGAAGEYGDITHTIPVDLSHSYIRLEIKKQ